MFVKKKLLIFFLNSAFFLYAPNSSDSEGDLGDNAKVSEEAALLIEENFSRDDLLTLIKQVKGLYLRMEKFDAWIGDGLVFFRMGKVCEYKFYKKVLKETLKKPIVSIILEKTNKFKIEFDLYKKAYIITGLINPSLKERCQELFKSKQLKNIVSQEFIQIAGIIRSSTSLLEECKKKLFGHHQ